LTGQTVLPSCRASRISRRTTGLASAAAVTTRMKCCSPLDFRASSIWVHQSRPPSRSTRSCQIERSCSFSQSRSHAANSAPSLREYEMKVRSEGWPVMKTAQVCSVSLLAFPGPVTQRRPSGGGKPQLSFGGDVRHVARVRQIGCSGGSDRLGRRILSRPGGDSGKTILYNLLPENQNPCYDPRRHETHDRQRMRASGGERRLGRRREN